MNPSVSAEYERLIPPLTPAEYEALKESIRVEGLLYPLMVNSAGIILDGHHRFKACSELGVTLTEANLIRREFPTLLEERRFVLTCNLRRRQLNDFQRAELGVELLKIERELARRRQLSSLTHVKEKVSIAPNGAIEGKAAEKVAREVGISTRTFERALPIIHEAPERLKAKLRAGELSISKGLETTEAIRLLRPTNLRDKVGEDRATHLAHIENASLRQESADVVIDENLGPQEVEALVRKLQDGETLARAVNELKSARQDRRTTLYRVRQSRQPCPTCEGRGWILRDGSVSVEKRA